MFNKECLLAAFNIPNI